MQSQYNRRVMREIIIRNILRLLAVVAIQLFVLNNIYFGGYINPMFYTIFILMLPNRMGRIYMLLLSFALGLCIDIFSNMLGFHAFACTIMAFCRITFADRIITRNEEISIPTPSFFTVAPQYFAYYSLILLFIHSLVFYTLDYFSMEYFFRILVSSILTTLVTVVLVVVWQMLFNSRKRVR